MDQVKIGAFISERRKAVGLTQMQLAEKLNITDRAVSKWERGRAMPDSSIMLELCDILEITVNDLLCGEVVTMDNYDKELEKNLIQLVKEKEKSDKRLLNLEIIVGSVAVAILLAVCILASYAPMDDWMRIVLSIIGAFPIIVLSPFLLFIEQVAGYYECQKCGHRYIPSFKSVSFSMHLGRTRYMKCPNCEKRSWQKKVISRDRDESVEAEEKTDN